MNRQLLFKTILLFVCVTGMNYVIGQENISLYHHKNNIEKFIDSQKFNTEWNQHAMGKQRFKGIVDYMMSEDWSNKLPQLQDYLKVLDQRRGTDFRTTFIELGKHI